MNKMELVAAMAAKTGMTKRASEESLTAFQEIVTKELSKRGGKIQLVGFGTFETSSRKARTGVNPKTRAKISIPASVVPKFKAGKALKDAVNTKKK
ncbi:MAG: HU family DNA-binding protein [Clostridia bacterium]|nr:HU family DNA-binding protein [Clostridia bacterium]